MRLWTLSLLALLPNALFGQPAGNGNGQGAPSSLNLPNTISLGTVRTEAERAAVRFLIDYIGTKVHDVFDAGFAPGSRSGSLFDLSPVVKIQVGDQDTFDGILAKIEGNYLWFNTTTVAGVVTPDSRRFWVMPLSIGFETDRHVRNLNTLLEAGIVPFANLSPRLKLGQNLRIGLFVQAGYKAKVEKTTAAGGQKGGAADQSEEKPDSALLRLKLDSALNYSPSLFRFRNFDYITLIGKATGWLDMAHGAAYHRVEGTIRFHLTTDRFLDLTYENGSGAPNFNNGDQFSANLTVRF
jgi:hypothetical protein